MGGAFLNIQNQNQPDQTSQSSHSPLVLPLSAIEASLLPLVGGKAANLGELIRAGLPVPDSFCATTAAYELASQQANLEPLLHTLAATNAVEAARLQAYASAPRTALAAAAIPTPTI